MSALRHGLPLSRYKKSNKTERKYLLSLSEKIHSKAFSVYHCRRNITVDTVYRVKYIFTVKNGEFTTFAAIRGDARFSPVHIYYRTIFHKIQKTTDEKERKK